MEDSFRNKTIIRQIVLGLIVFTLLMVILSANFIPTRFSLKVGQVSDRDIVSPRTVSFVDEVKTRKLEMEILASVANVYDLDTSLISKSVEAARVIFQSAETVISNPALSTVEARQDKLKTTLPAVSSLKLTDNILLALASLDKQKLIQAA